MPPKWFSENMKTKEGREALYSIFKDPRRDATPMLRQPPPPIPPKYMDPGVTIPTPLWQRIKAWWRDLSKVSLAAKWSNVIKERNNKQGKRTGIYEHHKGGLYLLLTVGAHHGTNRKYAVYVALTGAHMPGPRVR